MTCVDLIIFWYMMSIEFNHPFKNINEEDLLKHNDFIVLLYQVCKRSIEERMAANLWIYK